MPKRKRLNEPDPLAQWRAIHAAERKLRNLPLRRRQWYQGVWAHIVQPGSKLLSFDPPDNTLGQALGSSVMVGHPHSTWPDWQAYRTLGLGGRAGYSWSLVLELARLVNCTDTIRRRAECLSMRLPSPHIEGTELTH